MAVVVEELAGSPTFTYNRSGGSGQRTVLLDWGDVTAFLIELMPSSYMDGGNIVVPPAATFPGQSWLYAKSADVEPWDPESPDGDNLFPATYSKAKITIHYETEQFDQKDSSPRNDGPGGNQGSTGSSQNTFVSHKVSVGGEFMSWPANSLRFGEASDPSSGATEGRETKVGEDAMIGVIIPLIDHQITWHHVPFPPWAAMRVCVGSVNAYPFAGAPAETLLFLGADSSREVTNEGVRAWEMEYKYNEKNMNPFDSANPQGWNHFLRPDGYSAGTFQIVNRRAPGGYTTLSADCTDSQTYIDIASRASFPQEPENTETITLECENEWISWVNTPGSATDTQFSSITRGANGTTAVAHTEGKIVKQLLITTSTVAMTTTSTAVSVTSVDIFPTVGQFFVRIMDSMGALGPVNAELALVWKVDRTNGVLYLLRGVRKEIPKAHPVSAIVQMMYSPVYPLADFRLLYLSGLITG